MLDVDRRRVSASSPVKWCVGSVLRVRVSIVDTNQLLSLIEEGKVAIRRAEPCLILRKVVLGLAKTRSFHVGDTIMHCISLNLVWPKIPSPQQSHTQPLVTCQQKRLRRRRALTYLGLAPWRNLMLYPLTHSMPVFAQRVHAGRCSSPDRRYLASEDDVVGRIFLPYT